MRTDGIPYVQTPNGPFPPVDLNKMTLDEIKKKYIKTCGKANGNISVCSKCKTPCREGKRAIQLIANEVYSDPKIPLYGGKTLIERAKEENKARREAEEAKEIAEKVELHAEPKGNKDKPKRFRLEVNDWWEESLKYEDQVQFLVDRYGISKTQAKQKVYHAKRVKGEITVETPVLKSEPKEPEKKAKEEAPAPLSQDDLVTKTFEQRIDALTKKKSEYKALADEYAKKYAEVSKQIDVLYEAMDVFDKTI